MSPEIKKNAKMRGEAFVYQTPERNEREKKNVSLIRVNIFNRRITNFDTDEKKLFVCSFFVCRFQSNCRDINDKR